MKIQKIKSVLPKMSARSGLVGTQILLALLGPSEAIFSIGRKNAKQCKVLHIFLGGSMGPIHPVWALAAIRKHMGGGKVIASLIFRVVLCFVQVLLHVVFVVCSISSVYIPLRQHVGLKPGE